VIQKVQFRADLELHGFDSEVKWLEEIVGDIDDKIDPPISHGRRETNLLSPRPSMHDLLTNAVWYGEFISDGREQTEEGTTPPRMLSAWADEDSRAVNRREFLLGIFRQQ
jgi:hypothetical protein